MEKLCQCSISIIQIACCNNLAVFSLKLKSSPLCCKFVYFDPLAPSPKNNKVIKTCIIGFFSLFGAVEKVTVYFFIQKPSGLFKGSGLMTLVPFCMGLRRLNTRK